METKRLKGIDVVLTASDPRFTVTFIRHVESPLFVGSAKATLLSRFYSAFPEMDARIQIVRVYE